MVDTKLPLFDIRLQVYFEKVPHRVYLAPTMEEFGFEYKDKYVSVEIPKLEGHGMLVIE